MKLSPFVLLGGAALAALVLSSSKAKASSDMGSSGNSDRDTKPSPMTESVRALIRAEAERQGVPAAIALAFARVESNFNPRAEGDKQWHLNTKRYNEVVPRDSPYFDQPELWHSYGLYQLLAPYFVEYNEDPRILLSPEINAQRGIKRIFNLYRLKGGDLDQVRIAYVGAGQADAATQAAILARFHTALEREKRSDTTGVQS